MSAGSDVPRRPLIGRRHPVHSLASWQAGGKNRPSAIGHAFGSERVSLAWYGEPHGRRRWLPALWATAPRGPEPEAKMNDGDCAFAAALHHALRSRVGNLAYSPTSVRIALAMVAAGARGETATEMYDALALPTGEGSHATLGKTLASWAALATPALSAAAADNSAVQVWHERQLLQRRVVLRVVNRLWAQEGHAVRDSFTKVLDETYRAALGTVDFRHDSARAAINRWVADATEQKIKELIAGPLLPDTKLVITNAVYFKARWRSQFETTGTAEEAFLTADGHSVKVPLMRQTAHFGWARLDGATMVELPYGDGNLVMDVVLPADGEVGAPQGLRRLEEAYSIGAMASWIAALGPARVDLSIPRFHVSSPLGLVETLRSVGIVRAFKVPGADFSGIDGTSELFISNVVHQAFVDVDEHGTEASAATAMFSRALGVPPREAPIVFRADHAFLFFIRDKESNATLFAGRVADPSNH
jgi:serpin B